MGIHKGPTKGKAYQAQFTKEYPRYLEKKNIKIIIRQMEVRYKDGRLIRNPFMASKRKVFQVLFIKEYPRYLVRQMKI